MPRLKKPFLFLSALGAIAAAHAACSPTTVTDDGNDGFDDGSPGGDGDLAVGTGGIGGPGGDGDIGSLISGDGDGIIQPNGSAFPAEPIVVEGTDMGATGPFADPENFMAGSVCVFEPHLSDANGVGALYPMNWLRPAFRWVGTGTVWEIRLSAASQGNDLVVYTTKTEWTMPKELWDVIAAGVHDEITVTIRGVSGGSVVGMRGTFRIIPALAGGSMVFWGTKGSTVEPDASKLYGFTMGDEAVVETLSTDQVQSVDRVYTAKGTDLRGEIGATDGDYIEGFDFGASRCIGCHTGTPDGTGMIFTDDYPWNMGIASVQGETAGAVPDYVSKQALQFLKMPFLGTGMMMKTFWAEGDRTLLTTRGRRDDVATDYVYINYGYGEPRTYEPNVHDLIWIDLQTTATVSDTLPAATGDVAGEDPPYTAHYTGEERIAEAADRGDEILAAEGTAWGVLISEGNASISNPTPANLTNRIAYAVSETSYDGHPDWHNNTADIKIADITNPKGTATGTPLAGASDPAFLEYYPAFSPDDLFVAFNRAPAPSDTARCAEGKQVDRTAAPDGAERCTNKPRAQLGASPDGPYYNANGEIYIVPAAGGAPHRLRGNDPVMCSGEASPGVINSWPKWSSSVRDVDGKMYYFVVFSSARQYPGQFELPPTASTPPIDKRSSQLYMSVVEHDPATGAIVSYAPIYLWNQRFLATGPTTYEELPTANLTPVWEDFTIPEVPPVTVIR